MLHAPRPWVPAASVRCVVSRLIWSIATIGKLVPSPNHDFPPSRVTKGPTSLPAYKVSGNDGSSTSELTGPSGRLAVMFFQCWPPSVVLNTCPGLAGGAGLKPLYLRDAIRYSLRSTAIAPTGRPGKRRAPL